MALNSVYEPELISHQTNKLKVQENRQLVPDQLVSIMESVYNCHSIDVWYQQSTAGRTNSLFQNMTGNDKRVRRI